MLVYDLTYDVSYSYVIYEFMKKGTIVRRATAPRSWFFLFSHREIKAVLLVVSTLFLLLSLYSYTIDDQTIFTYALSPQPLRNWCGFIGAHIAALFFYIWGSSCWWWVASLIFYAYMTIEQKTWQQEWDRIGSYCFMPWVSAALLNAYGIDLHGNPVCGGFFGYHSVRLLHVWFDAVGTLLLLHALLIMLAILMIRFSFIGAIRWILSHDFLRMTKRILWLPLSTGIRRFRVWCKRPYHYFSTWYTRLWPRKVAPAYDLSHELDTVLYESATQDQSLEHFWKEVIHEQEQQKPHIIPQEETAAESIPSVAQEIGSIQEKTYTLPDLNIFIGVEQEQHDASLMQELEKKAGALQEKLERFGVFGKVVAIKRGPVVTLYEYQPQIDSKISKIIALEDDLALTLQALSIRIIAPIPGRSVIGFEVANKNRRAVSLANLIKSDSFTHTSAALPLILGEDTIGAPLVADLHKMPHVLMAGSTGSGKSVALNAMLISLLCKRSPDEVRLVIIDPKRLEFAPYADIAHLLFPIVTDTRQAAPVLRWVVDTMEERYELMAESGARNIQDYRASQAKQGSKTLMPYIVVIIDELADLMMTSGREIEDLLIRITQMARAAGIHVIAATQRPSVDVITGLIKVNFPSRISFRVTSKVDSRTILDCVGADKLLGYGDMLFLDATDGVLKRAHGAYVSDKEIEQVVAHIKSERTVEYLDLKTVCQQHASVDDGDIDEGLYEQIRSFLQEIDEVSISLLQRRFRIGYNRSARIIDRLEAQGLISPASSGKTRKVIR